MSTSKSLLAAAPSASSPRFDRRSTARSLWAVEFRLARAEAELGIQFSRIAQLQAELDRVLAVIRRRRLPVRLP